MKLTLHRTTAYADTIRAYKILADEIEYGTIKNGETVTINVPDDAKELRLKIDWCSSNIVALSSDVPEARFECGSSLKGARLFLSIFYIVFARKSYLWLREV